MSRIRSLLLGAALFCLLADAEACGRRRRACAPSVCFPACPLVTCPQPDDDYIPFPRPEEDASKTKVTLTFKNSTYSDHYVRVYLRGPLGVYRLYARYQINAGTSLTASGYYVGDQLLFHVWSRGYPGSPWQYRYATAKTLYGPDGVFDLMKGEIIYPAP